MRTVRGVSCMQRGLAVVGLAFLAASALAAKEPAAQGGSYAGEAVVRSLGDHAVLVALDETGSGLASRLFYVETREPVAALALRSAEATVESAESGLAVTLPRENRVLRFDLAAPAHRPGARRPAAAVDPAAQAAQAVEEGFVLTRIAPVASLAEYEGDGRSLDAVETADAAAGGVLQSLSSGIFQLPAPREGDDGGGCDTTCKAYANGGICCSVFCSANECAACVTSTTNSSWCSCFCT